MELGEVGKAWRNYLYANPDGKFNDAKDFVTRIEIIDYAQEQILEEMLKERPDMNLVNSCKSEIAFQRGELIEIATEFAAYCSDVTTEELEELLDQFCIAGIRSYMYKAAVGCKDIAKKAYKIFETLNDDYGHGLDYLQEDLCVLIMDAFEC